jgi:hypothetical protein
MAAVGNDLFVANSGGGWVTELDASTGALVSVISGSSYQFDGPDAMAAVGNDLFVANTYGDWVIEFTYNTAPMGSSVSSRGSTGRRFAPN